MKYKVISPFKDARTGKLVEVGDPLPKGINDERIKRLLRIRCIAAETGQESAARKVSKSAAKSDAGNGQTSEQSSKEGLFADDPAPMARGTGDAGGGGTEPDVGGSGDDQGQNEGHSD